ncbi:SDH family Clp fold serine proteinase [Paralcaligenes ginsengisoli]
MSTWGEMLQELNATQPQNFDELRRKYLLRLFEQTRRPTFVYASRWTQPTPGLDPAIISVGIGDVPGFMEVMKGITEDRLDLIIHSPGGSLEGVEAIVRYLRQKFSHIRAIIPHAAMSAATMLATSCDEIIMGRHSFLGPIDPQFVLQTPLGARMVAAQAILAQFNKAQEEISRDQSKLASWIPMLSQYGPDLLVQCQNASDLSVTLVKDWLSSYMLKDDVERAKTVAGWLGNHANHKTHSRFLHRDDLEAQGLKIVRLEEDQQLQDAVLSVFHAYTITFSSTPAAKIIESHLGKTFVQMAAPIATPQSPFQVQLAFGPPPPGPIQG